MAETTPTPTPPSAPSRLSKARASTSTMPYLVAAVFASSVMAWYFFVFVPSKLDYFVGLRFRTLAVASAQVKSKAENLVRALDGAINPLDDKLKPVIGPTDEVARGYFAALVPDMQLGRRDDSGLHISSVIQTGAQMKEMVATVAWADVVRAAAGSPRAVRRLILASSNGVVVWQREKTTPRVDLQELLSTRPSRRSGFLELAGAQDRRRAANGSAASGCGGKPVDLGGSRATYSSRPSASSRKASTASHAVCRGRNCRAACWNARRCKSPSCGSSSSPCPSCCSFWLPFIKLRRSRRRSDIPADTLLGLAPSASSHRRRSAVRAGGHRFGQRPDADCVR